MVKASNNLCCAGWNDQQNREGRRSREEVGSSPRTGNRWAGMTNEEPGPGGAGGKQEDKCRGYQVSRND